jgi:hypothetical protein
VPNRQIIICSKTDDFKIFDTVLGIQFQRKDEPLPMAENAELHQ